MIARALACGLLGHGPWIPVSDLPLCGRIRARCDRCGIIRLVRTH